MFGWLPGMSAKDAAGREIGNNQFNDTRSGITEDGWNWQDDFGAWLGGYTKEDVEKAGQTQLDKELQKRVNADYSNTGAELEGLGLKGNYTGSVTGLTQEEINKRTASDKSRLAALIRNQDIPNFDPTTLAPGASTAQILQAGSSQRDANTKTAKEEAEQLRQTIRNEGKEDLAESRKYAAQLQARSDARQDALLAHQTSEGNRRRSHEASETNKTRLHELALQEARNNQTMQLAMMDREDKLADRRYAREDRAADRRQQSIMMLIKGLAQLGQGFSL